MQEISYVQLAQKADEFVLVRRLVAKLVIEMLPDCIDGTFAIHQRQGHASNVVEAMVAATGLVFQDMPLLVAIFVALNTDVSA